MIELRQRVVEVFAEDTLGASELLVGVQADGMLAARLCLIEAVTDYLQLGRLDALSAQVLQNLLDEFALELYLEVLGGFDDGILGLLAGELLEPVHVVHDAGYVGVEVVEVPHEVLADADNPVDVVEPRVGAFSPRLQEFLLHAVA